MPLLGSRGGPPVALIVTPRYLPFLGGQERASAILAGEFARRGFQPVVVTEQLGLDTPRRERAGSVEIVRIPSSFDRTLRVQLRVAAAMGWHVLRRRRRIAFAVVRTFTVPGLAVGLLKALRLARFPTLLTAEEENDVDALAQRRLFPLSRRVISTHDILNGLGQANVDHLRRHGFPAEKITLIPNGIDVSAWPRTRPPERVRRFLFLGRLEREKGLFELLDAFAEVHRRHPDTTLTIAGDGPAREGLAAAASALGLSEAVAFEGRVEYERLGALFDSIDCLVLPSWSEGMPLSVLEAATHHRPMIISDVGDIRAMFGESVRLVPPRDTDALAAAMEAAVLEPVHRTPYDGVIERVAIGTVVDEMFARLGVGSGS